MQALSLLRLGLSSLLILGVATLAQGEDAVDGQLAAFLKKLTDKEAVVTKSNNAYANENRSSVRLKMIPILLAQGDYQSVAQLLNESAYGMPPELLDEWLKLTAALKVSLAVRQAAATEKLRLDVDQLVADSRKACLEAKSSADLDTVIVRCAALQAVRNPQSDVLSQRINTKLEGTAQALQTWARYLDLRDAGNKRLANESLKSLSTDNSRFPLLNVDDINARYLPVDDERISPEVLISRAYDGAKTPEDVPLVIERLRATAANPKYSSTGYFGMDISRLEGLNNVRVFIEKADYDSALAALGRLGFGQPGENVQPFLISVKTDLARKVVQERAKKWTELPMNPDEAPSDYLERLVDVLSQKGEYAQVIEVLEFSDKVDRSAQKPSGTSERSAIERFLAAQRFEAAGDVLAAATNYRLVVASSGPHVPTAKAADALKALIEKNPEINKSYEGVVLEDLRALRQQMQMLMNRMGPGGPMRPY